MELSAPLCSICHYIVIITSLVRRLFFGDHLIVKKQETSTS
jgi:hypothetical protein